MIGCLRRKKRKEMEKSGMRDINLFHTRLEKSCFHCIHVRITFCLTIQSSTRDFDSFPNPLNITIQVSPFPSITSLNSIQLKGFAVYERGEIPRGRRTSDRKLIDHQKLTGVKQVSRTQRSA